MRVCVCVCERARTSYSDTAHPPSPRPTQISPDLQRETDQPSIWLKEVLNDIALLNKRGPNKDLWELQKQYKSVNGANEGAAS